MHFSTVAVSGVLLTATLAAPQPAHTFGRRNAQSGLLIPAKKPAGVQPSASGQNVTAVQYSDNWSGSVITSPPSGSTFKNIVGTFNVPTPKAPTSGDGTWAGCAWVGIDGDTCQSAILQAGVDWSVTVSGGSSSTSYSAWIEWFPRPQVNFDFPVAAGDQITVECVASSNSQGSCTFTNQNGQKSTQTASAPSSSATLCGTNAEWIVEDYSDGGSLVPFANFGEVTFTGCSAGTTSGTVGPNTGTVFDIHTSSGVVLTDAEIPSSTEVTVTYKTQPGSTPRSMPARRIRSF